MAKFSPLMIAPPLVFAGLAVLFFVGMQRENPNELPTALAGKPAPVVEVEPMSNGTPLEDKMLRTGDVKLVNFWASWCAPCRVEHPNLEKMARDGITIYGINYKDNPANAARFLEELGNPYAAMGADESGRMGLNWGVYGVPETYVIDGKGAIVMRFAGPVTERALTERILPAIEKAKGN